jgi:hypothetical protein
VLKERINEYVLKQIRNWGSQAEESYGRVKIPRSSVMISSQFPRLYIYRVILTLSIIAAILAETLALISCVAPARLELGWKGPDRVSELNRDISSC